MMTTLSLAFLLATALPQSPQKPKDHAAALVGRAQAIAQTVDAMPRRLAKLEQSYGEYVAALRDVQPHADRFLVKDALILAAPDPSARSNFLRRPPEAAASASLQMPGPELPQAQLEILSTVLWNHEPFRTLWLDIRKRNDIVDFKPQVAKVRTLAAKRRKFEEIEPDWRDMAELVRTDKEKLAALEALVRDMDGEVASLDSWTRGLEETIARDLGTVGAINAALQCRQKALSFQDKIAPLVVWHEQLAQEVGMNARHRYAMKDRRCLFEQEMAWLEWWLPSAPTGPMQGWGSTKYTWPICAELFRAAKDFDFWYTWATDEKWYEGSDLRLDPAKWPRDDPKTKALHEEFARVVSWQHYVFEWKARAPHELSAKSQPPPPIKTETDWHEYAISPIGQQYESWSGMGAKLFNHLSLYFGPGTDARRFAADTGQRIPTGPAATPGQILPPLSEPKREQATEDATAPRKPAVQPPKQQDPPKPPPVDVKVFAAQLISHTFKLTRGRFTPCVDHFEDVVSALTAAERADFLRMTDDELNTACESVARYCKSRKETKAAALYEDAANVRRIRQSEREKEPGHPGPRR